MQYLESASDAVHSDSDDVKQQEYSGKFVCLRCGRILATSESLLTRNMPMHRRFAFRLPVVRPLARPVPGRTLSVIPPSQTAMSGVLRRCTLFMIGSTTSSRQVPSESQLMDLAKLTWNVDGGSSTRLATRSSTIVRCELLSALGSLCRPRAW